VTRLRVVAGVILLLLAAGCGGSSAPGSQRTSAAAASKVSGTVTVLAAASLTEAFTTLGKQFEARHPGTSVRFSFAASSELATQITQGAPADVFASASPATMQQVTDAGDAAGSPKTFARNRLEIAVPAGNPGEVTGLADFAKSGLKIALCAKEVPCGAAAVTAFQAAGVTPKPDTYEEDVKATLTKVQLGEVDAALVYRTDVKAAGDKVEGIDFPEAQEAINDYPIVTLRSAPNPATARAWVAYVLSPAGTKALTAAGFDRP
jgi:molybdate transport system substrate-binding protein